jgi:sugar phosphate isomerase/epimerase
VKPWLRDAAQRILNAHMQPSLALQSNSLLRTSRQGMDFLQILGNPHTRLAIDPAHLAAMGEDPVMAIRQLGKAVGFVVLRDTDGKNFNLSPGSGKLDYPAILSALSDIAYDGPVVLAIDDVGITPEKRTEMLIRGWEYLDNLESQRQAA